MKKIADFVLWKLKTACDNITSIESSDVLFV
jgi:hypothetical protein